MKVASSLSQGECLKLNIQLRSNGELGFDMTPYLNTSPRGEAAARPNNVEQWGIFFLSP